MLCKIVINIVNRKIVLIVIDSEEKLIQVEGLHNGKPPQYGPN